MNEQYNMELALRIFSSVRNNVVNKAVSDFLTDSLMDMCRDATLDRDAEATKFKKIFDLINEALGEDAFKSYRDNRFKGKFLESAFEAIVFGLYKNIESYGNPLDEKNFVINKVKKMWSMKNFTDYSGSGSNARQRIPKMLEFGMKYFKKNG